MLRQSKKLSVVLGSDGDDVEENQQNKAFYEVN